jgi:ribonuclease VapC
VTQKDDLDVSPGYVLDASALLALLKNEPGEDVVGPLLESSIISSVNWTEVLDRAIAGGMEARNVRVTLESAGLRILPFTTEDAELTARLWSVSRQACPWGTGPA